jgi:hypothetical protein
MNEHCRYSHVHVAPDAPICDAFAKIGYCEKGPTCFDRHEWECPTYASTGACPNPHCRLPHIDKAGKLRSNNASSAAGPNAANAPNAPNASIATDSLGASVGQNTKVTAPTEPGPTAAQNKASSSPEIESFESAQSFIPLSLDEDDHQFEQRYKSDSEDHDMADDK